MGGLASDGEEPRKLVRDQAMRMQENITRFTRFDRLRAQQDAMRDSGSVARVRAFLMDFDRSLASATFQAYVVALPLTMEAAFFVVFGYLVSFFALLALISPFSRRGKEVVA